MRKQQLLLWIACVVMALSACNNWNDEFDDKGSATITFVDGPKSAFMGDSITYSFKVEDDGKVSPDLSKVQVVYGEETVFERLIVTGMPGTYTGQVYIPFLKDIPDGDATLKLQVKNSLYASDMKEIEIAVSRPVYSYLTLRTEDQDYRMEPDPATPYLYRVTGEFSSELLAYIIAPVYGENGNVITFGSSDGKISHGLTSDIEFTADTEGEYDITFNTLTYEGTPFIKFALNDVEFERVDDANSAVEMELKQGEEIHITGLKDDYVNYWIDPSFFDIVKNTDRKILKFRGMDAKYRVTVNKSLKYFMVELMDGPVLAEWATGGGIWVIGSASIGKPSYQSNGINWDPNKGFCMAPVGGGKYQMILQAGTQIDGGNINFKFFGQKAWGYEFKSANVILGENSSWFRVNNASSDDGNVFAGTTSMISGKYYVVTLDTSVSPAVMTVVELDEIPEVEE